MKHLLMKSTPANSACTRRRRRDASPLVMRDR